MFQVTFQVMDIFPAYSCLLGRPWIHEAGALVSTLHQKLKFVRNGKVVIINGERAMLVSHLSSFHVVEADEAAVGTSFQALSIDDDCKKSGASIYSYKDAQQVVHQGPSNVWGQVIEISENKNKAGLGFSHENVESMRPKSVFTPYQEIFRNGGFVNPKHPEVDVVLDDEPEFERPSYVTQ